VTFALRRTRQAGRDKLSVVLGEDFPTTKNAVAIDGIEFAKPSPTSRLVRGDQRRAGASEEVKNDAAAARNVLNRVGDHLDRLDCWMQLELIEPTGFEGVDAAIFPHVGAIAAVLAKLETVDVEGWCHF
jgi:hypothetical protein